MNMLDRVSAEWSLRIGLGLMYLYSGYDIMMHPTSWLWALPLGLKQFLDSFIGTNNYLVIQGAGEIVLALVLLIPFVPKKIVMWAALLSTLEMLGILLFEVLPYPWGLNNMGTTFRDLGLLGASFALFLISRRRNPQLG